jgi:glutathione synthase/RimK-type ligase-like ATP-grasp enzyme
MPDKTLAEALNRSCQCIAVDRKKLEQSLAYGFAEPGSYARLRESHPNLLADFPIFVAREHIAAMQAVIDAIEHVVSLEPYREAVLAWAPAIARHAGASHGVFFGYDFHLTTDGPRLIEVNTNAGGALLLQHVASAQQACCREVGDFFPGPNGIEDMEQVFVNMFRDELRAQRTDDELACVAIVDEEPQAQYLSPEFELFREMFTSHGIEAIIADPRDFVLQDNKLIANGRTVDLVYNRLTDFYLQSPACATLREACERGAAVFTPSPRDHALYANKRNLSVLSDEKTLRKMGASDDAVETLSVAVPRTVLVSADNAAELWAERRELFFKPASGYGSRGTYKGAKLTKKTWLSILQSDYVAQALVPPGERLLVTDGAMQAYKVDIRCYVYRGEIQLLGARMYRGQTTNFRTDGGGLAAVFTTP